MKATAIVAATALLLALPVVAQTTETGPRRDQVRKQDGTGTGKATGTQSQLRERDQVRKQDGTGMGTATGTQSQLRKRDGSCGNPNPTGTRGAGQGARKGQGR